MTSGGSWFTGNHDMSNCNVARTSRCCELCLVEKLQPPAQRINTQAQAHPKLNKLRSRTVKLLEQELMLQDYMPQALMYRQVAGFPIWPFCAKHDRFVEPISMLAADGTKRAVCPYCADEELQCGTAESAVKETTQWSSTDKRGGVLRQRRLSDLLLSLRQMHLFDYEHLALRDHIAFIHREKTSLETCLQSIRLQEQRG
jgi:hypothetical protein